MTDLADQGLLVENFWKNVFYWEIVVLVVSLYLNWLYVVLVCKIAVFLGKNSNLLLNYGV